MRKIFLVLLSILMIGLCSCKKEKSISIVKVHVLESGHSKSGITVCMFESNKGASTSFFTPFHSDKKVVTESDGIATFELQEVHDLEVIDNQTTLYFGVFNNTDLLLGKGSTTIKKGETKSITINL